MPSFKPVSPLLLADERARLSHFPEELLVLRCERGPLLRSRCPQAPRVKVVAPPTLPHAPPCRRPSTAANRGALRAVPPGAAACRPALLTIRRGRPPRSPATPPSARALAGSSRSPTPPSPHGCRERSAPGGCRGGASRATGRRGSGALAPVGGQRSPPVVAPLSPPASWSRGRGGSVERVGSGHRGPRPCGRAPHEKFLAEHHVPQGLRPIAAVDVGSRYPAVPPSRPV